MSILRDAVNPKAFEANPTRALLAAAIRVRRAGLEHLVTEVTDTELLAMETAGEALEEEWATLLVAKLNHPAAAYSKYDGGVSLRAAVKRAAFAAPRG